MRVKMTRMISAEIQAEVLLLLAVPCIEGGLNFREIALAVGISRGSVDNISRCGHVRQKTYQRSEPPRQLQRCPTCGGMVYLPCRECSTPHPHRLYPKYQPGDLALNLRSGDLNRYKKIRARKNQQIEEHGPDR